MRFTWDPTKAAANLAKHGMAFEAVNKFEFETALVRADVRFGYSEPRLRALGAIGGRLHTMIYTVAYRATRLISLRRASEKEIAEYESEG